MEVDSLGELKVDEIKYVATEVHEESRRTLDVLPGLLRGLVEGLSFTARGNKHMERKSRRRARLKRVAKAIHFRSRKSACRRKKQKAF